MSFLFSLLEVVLMAVVTLDTLSFVVQSRKNPTASDARDYHRLCFTWIFFLAVRSLLCCSYSGIIGSTLALVSLAAKVYVSVPLLNGTENLYNMLVDKNVLRHHFENLVNLAKARLGLTVETKSD